MASHLISPPWFKGNRITASKLQRNRRLKAKGLAPVPATKTEQRALLATLEGHGRELNR